MQTDTLSARAIVEREIEHLIDLLDLLDADPDLEENGDLEPSLGPDYRGETDLEADDSDDEPSLGARELHETQSQASWALGGTRDFEEECEDEGAQCDDEGYQDPDGDMWSDDEPIFPSDWRPISVIEAESLAIQAAADRLGGIIARVKGREAALAGRSAVRL